MVNGSSGVTATLNPSMVFVISGNVYGCTWTDLGAEGQLTAGDVFQVTRTGGLLDGTAHTLVLLSTDGSRIASATYP